MAVRLDHTIVPAKDKLAAAQLFAEIFGLAVKPATGISAPIPVTALVSPPPLAVLITRASLKLEALLGANRITKLVEPKPGRVKGVAETTTNGPVPTKAVASLREAPP